MQNLPYIRRLLGGLRERETQRILTQAFEALKETPPEVSLENPAEASTPGTVIGRVEVFDGDGNSLGFIALYDEVTP